MKQLLTLLLLIPASACFAQNGYTYVVENQAKLGNEAVPTYRTLADTASKPSNKLFAHSTIYTRGRVGNRWAIVRKNETEYLVRTSDLPAEVQQVVLSATPIKAIPFDPASGKIDYSEVVQVAGANQAELYARAKLWFADTFKSAKAVVQADDKDTGIIQGTAFQDISVVAMGIPSAVKLWYTIKIALKDGRYKYDITDLRVQNYPSQYNLSPGEPTPAEAYINTDQKKGIPLSIASSARREVAIAGTALSASITAGMNKPAAGKDW